MGLDMEYSMWEILAVMVAIFDKRDKEITSALLFTIEYFYKVFSSCWEWIITGQIWGGACRVRGKNAFGNYYCFWRFLLQVASWSVLLQAWTPVATDCCSLVCGSSKQRWGILTSVRFSSHQQRHFRQQQRQCLERNHFADQILCFFLFNNGCGSMIIN